MKSKSVDKYAVSIDEMLSIVGEYGRFQKLVNVILFIMTIPPVYHIMIMYFAADEPEWKCTLNSTRCLYNGTLPTHDDRRCLLERTDWEYAQSSEYSIVTYFDINCDQRWLLELLESILFIGWILGSFILGWFCDNYGRKLILIISMNIVMVTGLSIVFMPSVHFIIACRFIIGFFLPGTLYQCFIIMTELVGGQYRPFAGLMIFAAAASSFTILGVKAYFIRNWKYLHVACTVPYIFLLFFYNFIPESIRYLRVKGKMDKLMNCFQRIAYWNKTEIPTNFYIIPPHKDTFDQTASPLRLFGTKSIASKTSVQTIVYFSTGIVYYGVFLAAGEMSGSMYRDFILISACELPVNFIAIDFCERFGRKKTTMTPMIFACLSCLFLSFAPKIDHWKIARVITGIVGKCLVGSIMNTISTWSTELYPTQVRGAAMGFFQAFVRLGAASAPWLDKEIVKIHKAAPFLFMASVSFISFCAMSFLPETKNMVTRDTEEDENIKSDTHSALKFLLSSNEVQSLNSYKRFRDVRRPHSRSCIQF